MTGDLAVATERLGRVYEVRGGGGARTLVALDDVTLSVRRGELFGVLGMNGAGKTTLLRILAAALRPSSGVARVAGVDVCRHAGWVRRHVATVHAGDRSVMRLFKSPLSTGQRQRVKLVRGLLANPTVLLLDQPTLGLDCAAARTARASIRRWTGAVALEAAFLDIVRRGAWADA